MFIRRKAIATQSDEELVIRLKGGDQPSLAALWDRYAHLLFGVCMKYLQDTEKAKDAVVELFGTLPELLAKHEVKSFRPWIHTVARNRCLMLLRKRDPRNHWMRTPTSRMATMPTKPCCTRPRCNASKKPSID